MRPTHQVREGQGGGALQAGVILLAGIWIYFPALRGGWLWDDPTEISQNAWLHDPAGLARAWSSTGQMDYFPVKSTVQWVLWHLWGDQTLGYHLVSLSLHLLSGLLLWKVLAKLGVRLAWLGGLLFVIHPLAVESVAWISELKNTLSLALLLLAALAYLAFDAEGAPRGGSRVSVSYSLSALGFLAAMLSKSTVVMFPCVLLVHAWWRRGRIARRDVLASLPFFAISLVLGMATLWFQHHRAMPGAASPAAVGALSRLAAAGMAVGFYFWKALFPHGFLPIYPRWAIDPPSCAQVLPGLAVAAVLGWLWTQRATWGRPALLGLGWFLLNLLPVLGLIPMAYQRISGVADHFAYLPLAGLAGLAAAGLSRWYRSSEPGWARGWLVAGTVLIAAGLALESHAYAAVFRSEETLWTYTLRRNPDAWVAASGLGKVRLDEGRLTEAVADFRRAAAIEPDSAEVQANLGDALFRLGDRAEAMVHFQAALRLDPGFAGAHYNLGSALLQAGQPVAAANQFAAALRINPAYAAAQNNLGLALARLGRPAEAVPHYQEALRLKPDFPEALLNLGNAYFNAGRMEAAIAHYQAALRIDPRYAAAHHNLGFALQRVGRGEEAQAQFAEAARLSAKP
jgi:tetratricopeptide (TPR) repeat protein